jgi:hypothetical protein
MTSEWLLHAFTEVHHLAHLSQYFMRSSYPLQIKAL